VTQFIHRAAATAPPQGNVAGTLLISRAASELLRRAHPTVEDCIEDCGGSSRTAAENATEAERWIHLKAGTEISTPLS